MKEVVALKGRSTKVMAIRMIDPKGKMILGMTGGRIGKVLKKVGRGGSRATLTKIQKMKRVLLMTTEIGSCLDMVMRGWIMKGLMDGLVVEKM